MHWIAETVKHYLVAWGYWAVILGLFVEDAGFPVPGETLLIFASFLAYQHHHLKLWVIILCGVAAATCGDNLGFWIGREGGRPLLKRWKYLMHLTDDDIAAGEGLLRRRGSVTIFIARFLPGMRILAGPLAGVLDMPWRQFVLFNFLGACTWVTAIASIGYLFGSQYDNLEHFFRRADLLLGAGVIAAAYYLWRRYKKQRRSRMEASHAHSGLRAAPEHERRPQRRRRIG